MRVAAAALATWLLVAACSEDTERTTTGHGRSEGRLEGTITVFAAASLTDAFGLVGPAFERTHPDVTIEFNFAASSTLREQILAGAPADVFASADTSNMDRVVSAGAATGPIDFVENRPQIAVPVGNPARIRGLADLARKDLLIGLCAEHVPCGRFAREALANAGVTPSVDTNEPDVRSLLTKLVAGDLDAGIVYRTDVRGAEVEGIDIPAAENVIATYPIVVLDDSASVELAQSFVSFVLSEAGQSILGSYGFEIR